MTTEERLAIVETEVKQVKKDLEKLINSFDSLRLELTGKKGLATGIVISATTLASLITFLLTYFKGLIFGNG